VLEADTWDLNKMLSPEHRLAGDSVVTYTYACATVLHRGRRVLIDAGYHAQEVVDALAELGVAPGDVDLVLLTHGDGDHIVGLLTEDGALTYPRAEVVMHRDLWEYWTDPEAHKALPDERRRFLKQLIAALADRVTLFADETEVAEGILAIPSLGHRHGHSIYQFAPSVGGNTPPVIHSGDSLFHPLLVEHPEWTDALALDPAEEAASRRRLLEHAAASGALVLTGHIAFPGMGRIRAIGEAFRWEPAV